MKEIKAKPTEYKGIRFRSKLEAQVAYFFDLCHISWLYEPDRLDDGEKEYNPDFYLPETDDYIEVKGARPGYEQEILKARSFVSFNGPIKRLIIISEIPDPTVPGMPHFPCYFASARHCYGDDIETGWYFFQDVNEERANGHISSSFFKNPCIDAWNIGNKRFPFSIRPVSDWELSQLRTHNKDDEADEADMQWDRYSKETMNKTVFSAFAKARKADFTMRKVTGGEILNTKNLEMKRLQAKKNTLNVPSVFPDRNKIPFDLSESCSKGVFSNLNHSFFDDLREGGESQ